MGIKDVVFSGSYFAEKKSDNAELTTVINFYDVYEACRPVEFVLRIDAGAFGTVDNTYIHFGSFAEACKFATNVLCFSHDDITPFGVSLDFSKNDDLRDLLQELTILISAGLCAPVGDKALFSALVERYRSFAAKCSELNKEIEWVQYLEAAVWFEVFKDQL